MTTLRQTDTGSLPFLLSLDSDKMDFHDQRRVIAGAVKLLEADSVAATNPKRAEEIYKRILDSAASTSNGTSSTGERDQSLRGQEAAMIKLAELHRDQKSGDKGNPSNYVYDTMAKKKITSDGGGKASKDATGGTKGQGGTRKTKKTKVGDTLVLDQRPSGEGKLEALVEHKMSMDDRAQKAIFGYARLDLIVDESKLRFGTWNPRPLKQDQVNRLVQSFLTKGADRFAYTKAIPLVVSKTDVKEGTYKTTYEPGSHPKRNLPLLEVTEEAKGKRMLIAAGGQHRLHAVIQWTKMLTKQLEDMTKNREALEKQDIEMVDEGEIQQENKTSKPKRDSLRETLALGGQWMVILYDAAQVTLDLGLHLSENMSEHVYRQTPEEGLIHTFRTMNVAKKTHLDVDLMDGVTGTPRMCADMLSQEYIWDFMEIVEPMGIHMIDGKRNMTLKRLHRTLLGTSGGILVYMVGQMECHVLQCFNTIPLEEKDVDILVRNMTDCQEEEWEDACKELKRVYATMQQVQVKSEMKCARGAGYAVRECMDNAFVQHLGASSPVGNLFGNQKSHRWKRAVQDYYDQVIADLPNVIESIPQTDAPIDEDEREALASLKWCVAKMKILKCVIENSNLEKSMSAVPFMTRSVYSHMEKMLDVIDHSLKEFCCWWEPFVEMVPIIGKYWKPGSPSAAAIRAIRGHGDIEEKRRPYALRAIVFIIWNDYASFVNMETQLKDLSAPPRITVQKKLLSVFGVTADGQQTKDQREARQAVKKKKEGTSTTTTKGKGKSKAKVKGKTAAGKKRAQAVSEDDDDEEDDDDDDDDDVEDDDDDDEEIDSAYLESDEEVDGEDEEEDKVSKRKACADIRKENTLKKQLAAIAKNDELVETHRILTGKKIDGTSEKKVAGPPLNFDRPPNFLRSWKKVSRLSNDYNRIAMRGLGLIDSTTWEWKSTPQNSFSRVMRTFSAAAIAEAAAIISYRPELLFCNQDGGAATLRMRAQSVVRGFLAPRDKGQTSQLHQTTLKDLIGSASQGWKKDQGSILAEGKLPPPGCITWADGLYMIEPTYGVTEHMIEAELPLLQRDRLLGVQERAVQKAIDGVQNTPVAWYDPTNSATAQEKPTLDANVASILRDLVDALNANAYRQRMMATRTLKFDAKKATEARERLHINVRTDTPGEDSVEDRFLMGAPKMLHELDIPTKMESIEHLEELARRYSRWVEAHSKKPFKFVDEKETQHGEEGEDEDGEGEVDVDAAGSVHAESPPLSEPEGLEDEEEDEEDTEQVNDKPNHIETDAAMYEDLPVDSAGEFVDSDIPPPSNQLALYVTPKENQTMKEESVSVEATSSKVVEDVSMEVDSDEVEIVDQGVDPEYEEKKRMGKGKGKENRLEAMEMENGALKMRIEELESMVSEAQEKAEDERERAARWKGLSQNLRKEMNEMSNAEKGEEENGIVWAFRTNQFRFMEWMNNIGRLEILDRLMVEEMECAPLLPLRERNEYNAPFKVDATTNHLLRWVRKEGLAIMEDLTKNPVEGITWIKEEEMKQRWGDEGAIVQDHNHGYQTSVDAMTRFERYWSTLEPEAIMKKKGRFVPSMDSDEDRFVLPESPVRRRGGRLRQSGGRTRMSSIGRVQLTMDLFANDMDAGPSVRRGQTRGRGGGRIPTDADIEIISD
ncbi:hypothetical protein L210DRAFT_3763940 [Boletus edulis BED1]|uniref:Uncharacterized protein n=1 Tax=Boletus edulis BED1 TaxID=1328754 RepID=A0AAD4BJR6_BOLED|nr:hypothetical protein L210DRAFT_3763940 [Boletus edulis BED1]